MDPRACDLAGVCLIDLAIDAHVPSDRWPTLKDLHDSAERISNITHGASGYMGIPFPPLLKRLKERMGEPSRP